MTWRNFPVHATVRYASFSTVAFSMSNVLEPGPGSLMCNVVSFFVDGCAR